MSTQVKADLNHRRGAAWHSAKALLDHAESESRNLTVAESKTWDRLNAEIDNLDARLKALTAEERLDDTARAFASLGRGASSATLDPDIDRAFRDAVLRRDPSPIAVENLDRRSGFQPGLERRDLLTSTGSGMTPTSFYGQVIAAMVDSSAILAAGATVVASESGESLKVPKSTASSTAAIISEGGSISESDPGMGTLNLGAYKYGFSVQVSYELAQDSSFDLLAYLSVQAGAAIGNGFGVHAISGDGSSKPRGIVTDSTLGVTGATSTAGVFTSDNLIDLYHSLAEPYARSSSAAWLMRSATLGAVRKLKDSQGRYMFDTGSPTGSGAAGTLLGRPVFLDPNVAAVGLSAKSVVFGDISKYWVRQVGGLRFERSDDYAFQSDLVTFRALARLDGALVDTTGAVRYFVGGAS